MLKKCFITILTIGFTFSFKSQTEWKYTGPKEMTQQVKGMIKSLWMEDTKDYTEGVDVQIWARKK